MQNEIDIVIPWVDGGDPEWQAQHRLYKADKNSDNSSARFRDWETLRYWFRGIHKFAPWVRKVHFLTWGHLPKWLDTSHPKLNIVNHRDFIPEKYLPTFSSHVIELNMHRIPDLAERFVYFNDDVYLTSLTSDADFFKDGIPADAGVFGIVKNTDTANFMPYIMLNMMAIINMNFSKRSMIKKDFGKWFSPRLGKMLFNNLYLAPFGAHTGFRNFHTCTPFLKSTFETVWEKIPDILDDTCSRKFRSRSDVNQYLFRYWQLCEGKFKVRRPMSTYLTIGQDSSDKIKSTLNSKKFKVVCVNDDPMGFDFIEEQEKLVAVFEGLFPEKSPFEKS